MGFCESWVAIKGKFSQEMLQIINQDIVIGERIDEEGDEDCLIETGLYLVELENGFSLVIGSGSDFVSILFEVEEKFLELSNNRELYFGYNYEDANAGSLYCLKDKIKVWEVWAQPIERGDDSSSNGQEHGSIELYSTGDLPESFYSIHDKALAEQQQYLQEGDEVDCVSGIPTLLGEELIGYGYGDASDCVSAFRLDF